MQPKTNRVVVFGPADLGQRPRIKTNQVTCPCFSVQDHTEQISRILGLARAIWDENRLGWRMRGLFAPPVLDCLRLKIDLANCIEEGSVSSVDDAIVVSRSFGRESRVDRWKFTGIKFKDTFCRGNCSDGPLRGHPWQAIADGHGCFRRIRGGIRNLAVSRQEVFVVASVQDVHVGVLHHVTDDIDGILVSRFLKSIDGVKGKERRTDKLGNDASVAFAVDHEPLRLGSRIEFHCVEHVSFPENEGPKGFKVGGPDAEDDVLFCHEERMDIGCFG